MNNNDTTNNKLIGCGGTQGKNSTASISGIDAHLEQLHEAGIDFSTPLVQTHPLVLNKLVLAQVAHKNQLSASNSSPRCTPELIQAKMEKRGQSCSQSQTSASNSSNASRRRAQKGRPKIEHPSPPVEEAVADPPKTIVVTDDIGGELVYLDCSDQKNPVIAKYSPWLQVEVVKQGEVMTNIVRDNLGYYLSSEPKGVAMLASSPFTLRTMGQTFDEVGFTDQRSHLIFVPLYKELVHLFKAHREDTAIKTAQQQAIKNVVSTFKNKIRMPLTQKCVETFAAICDYTEAYYRLGVLNANHGTRDRKSVV